jgi:thiol-disulfide isomerase/thioredoxin
MKPYSIPLRALRAPSTRYTARQFSTTHATQAKNRIFPAPVRSEDELQTLLLMSASTRTPLLTLWKTNWCSSCQIISPLIRELVEKDGIGEEEGGVSFVEVEMDSPDLGGVGGIPLRYMINSIPTLLAFDRQEPQQETKVSRLDDLKNRAFLKKWIETEAARQGKGGAGGSLFGGFFGR